MRVNGDCGLEHNIRVPRWLALHHVKLKQVAVAAPSCRHSKRDRVRLGLRNREPRILNLRESSNEHIVEFLIRSENLVAFNDEITLD